MGKKVTERNIIVLAIIIVLAVGISGSLVHKSMTQIVDSIQEEASTNRQLIIVKNISLDLLELENTVRLYSLNRNKSSLENYKRVNDRLNQRIAYFSTLPGQYDNPVGLNDSIRAMVETKQHIWEEIKNINTTKSDPQPEYDELYSMLGEVEIDTITTEVVVPPEPKKGLFRKVFGKKDTATIRIDTTYVERTVENEEIKEQIKELEQLASGLRLEEQRKAELELELIQRNILVTSKLNYFIGQIEQAERDNLIAENKETDRLAKLIYKRLSSFAIVVVILLFIVLYFFVRYLWSTKKVERALRKAKQSTENLAKAKEVFMVNVSHEMRTPVNAIYGLSEQLLQEKTSEDVNEKLEILRKSSRHLKEVVNDTLDFSKIQANKLKLTNHDFAPEYLINEVITILRPEAETKNIQLINESESKLPRALKGDPFRLKQVLINIIGNAIKFTEKGSVTLDVKHKVVDESFYHLDFQVKDTGIGISEENIDLIFDDFVQIETDYTRRFSGTGLGLSIVKRLIELQKGEISIKSKINSGTVVSFYIPYEKGKPENIESHDLPNLVVPDKIKSLKILGVDDEDYNLFLLRTIFKRWGVNNYFEAKDGNEAVRLVSKHDFDLILMDLRMPKLNGIEASKQIIKERPDTKIIALATINSDTEMKMCIDAGMKKSLSKPFAEQELLETIISVCDENVNGPSKLHNIDLRELERLANGDKAFVQEMIELFVRSAKDGIKTIKEAFENADWIVISEAAHKMAAPCKHIGADDLYADLKQLENMVQKEKFLDEISQLIENIDSKIHGIISSLSRSE